MGGRGRPRITVGYSSTGNNHPHRVAGALPVYWDPMRVIHPLPLPDSLPNGAAIVSAEAVAVSDDGRLIAGNLHYVGSAWFFWAQPCLWQYDMTLKAYRLTSILQDLSGGDLDARASHISGSGTAVVGYGNADGMPFGACKWPISSGVGAPPVALTQLPNTEWSIAMGSDKSGSLIVGYCGASSTNAFGFAERATLWTSVSTPKNLADILTAATPPVTLPPDWQLEACRISDSGKVIVGSAFHFNPVTPDSSLVQQGWVARIP